MLLVLPGANRAAILLDSTSIVRDPQGQRLGDRIAQTQVVDGLGAKDLAEAFMRWRRELVGGIDGSPGRRRRARATQGRDGLS